MIGEKTQLDSLQPVAVVGDQPKPLNDEWRLVRVEPVALVLTDDEPPVIGRTLHRAQEELQGRRIDDLRAVVKDLPVAIDGVVVLPHGRLIVFTAATISATTASVGPPSRANPSTTPARSCAGRF